MTSKTITDRDGDTLRISDGSFTARPGDVTLKVNEKHAGREHSAAVHVDPRELRAALDEVAPGFYTRHESPDYADGGVTAAAVEKEAERVELADDPDYWHAKFCEARQERDELRQTRRRLLGKVDQLEVKLRNSGRSAEQAQALTPDAITDEARDRAYRAVAALSVCDWDDMSGVAKGRAMALVAAVIAEITRPEPPARPEGAEDVAVRLFQAGAAVGVEMTAEQRDALADHLAAMHVRVVGEDGAA